MRAARGRVLVSAHRCNDRALIERAIDLGADYVEFDLVREGDAVVVAHDPGSSGTIGYPDVLALLAASACGVHLDLKFGTATHALEVEVVEAALAAVGVERLVVTTGRERVIRHLRDWADTRGQPLRLGLSLGTDTAGRPWRERWRVLRSELFPASRLAACGADVVVAHWSLAALTLRGYCRRHRVPLLVWTVDSPRALAYWLRPGRAWMVTTNRPAQALHQRPAPSRGRQHA
ncbi:hypothetical protein GCM10022215_35010 [Nocardioides fonticola]|uniref:Glycerophosphodiester phosphodiesterase n=1 Tax=Nocardioides fonticola TaxID=450363 RepID=A0ABP7XUH9_9ACTN